MESSRVSVGGNRPSKKRSVTSTRKLSQNSLNLSPSDADELSHTIDLDIIDIKNVVSKYYPIEVNLTVFFKQRLLTTTPNFIIKNPGKLSIDFNFKFRVRKINNEMIDQLLSEPLLIILTKLRQGQRNKHSYFSLPGMSGSRRFRNKLDLLIGMKKPIILTDEEKAKLPKKWIKSFKGEDNNILPSTIGECTLDLLPLIKGEQIIEDDLLMERPIQYNFLPLRMRPLNTRVVLRVRVSDNSDFTKSIPPLHNYLMYTVESLYNLNIDKLLLAEYASISASMPLPLNVPTKVDDRQVSLYHFEPGIVSQSINIDYKRKWFGLSNVLRGKGVYSSYRTPMGFHDIKNDVGVNLKENMESRKPRVNWNIMRRIFLTPELEDVYKYLPVEIIFNSTGADLKVVSHHASQISMHSLSAKQHKRHSVHSRKSVRSLRRKISGPPLQDIAHFIAFLDISNLLSPGVKKTRIAAPLVYLKPDEYKEKWNITQSLLKSLIHSEYKIDTDWPNIQDLTIDGQPSFIIVEVSLMNPLIPAKEELDWNKPMFQLATEKLYDDPITKHKVPMDHFAQAIKFSIFLIKREMEDFYRLKHCEKYSEVTFYKNMDFWGHLGHSGATMMINETLRKSISDYINNVLGAPEYDLSPLHKKEYMEILYFKVIDKIHQVINSLLTDYNVENIVRYSTPNNDELLLYAVEAAEQLQYAKARYYLTKRLEMNGYRNPDYWFDYGIMALRFGDMYLAIESMKEVLAINSRHRMGLLVYAILLTIMGEYEEAEKFFYATVKFYPTFWQAWVVFHIFYKLIELYDGSDITFVMGMRYMSEFPMKEEWQPYYPLLSWYTDVCSCFNVYLETAKFLLRYNLFEFAEMCLAQYLEEENRKDVCYYYYLAVCHFIQGRFSDSLVHLEQLMEETGFENYKIWTLVGYNYHNLNDTEHARKAFIEAQRCLNDFSQVPLMLIRMGFDLIERSCPEKGREMFLETLKWHITPLAWIGLGVSYYLLEEYDNAEIAFSEANAIDPNLAIVWSYLALLFLNKHNLYLYVQALIEAKRCGLEDKNLFNQLEILHKKLVSPKSSQNSIENKITSYFSINCFPKCCGP